MNPEQPPQFGYPTGPNPYQLPASPEQAARHKKQFLLMAGGGLLIVIILLWLLFSGGGTGGQADMQAVMQNTSDSLGVLDEYQEDIGYARTKSDLALAQIILRGNYQSLNELYKDTYKSKKRFTSSPKPDEKSAQTLDSAQRANRLDSEIISVLKPKIAAAQQALERAKPNFGKASSVATLTKAKTDLAAISELLDQPR